MTWETLLSDGRAGRNPKQSGSEGKSAGYGAGPTRLAEGGFTFPSMFGNNL
jgi:hypothetical protein